MASDLPVKTYSVLARIIHWISALCIFLLIPAGLIMAEMPEGPAQNRLFMLHESFGIVVLMLTCMRIGRKIFGSSPAPAPLARHERIMAHSVHGLIYCLLLATPLNGWLGVSAYGADVNFFGLFTLPALTEKNQAMTGPLFTLHLAAACLIGVLVILHITGVVRHILRRDGVIERMLPSYGRKKSG